LLFSFLRNVSVRHLFISPTGTSLRSCLRDNAFGVERTSRKRETRESSLTRASNIDASISLATVTRFNAGKDRNEKW
jgi:hypothetical protein